MSIVITGTPGVGKHTITNQIAKKLELEIIDINKVAKESGLFEENQDTKDVDTEKLGKIIRNQNLKNTIIVGHLAPYVLEKNQIKKIIILRRNPYDLITSYKQRQYTDKKSRENAGSEILGVIAHDVIKQFSEKAFQIDNSGKSIDETVREVLDTILGNHKDVEIDWLNMITAKNDLKKFFVD